MKNVKVCAVLELHQLQAGLPTIKYFIMIPTVNQSFIRQCGIVNGMLQYIKYYIDPTVFSWIYSQFIYFFSLIVSGHCSPFAAAHLNWFYRLLNKLHSLILSGSHTHTRSRSRSFAEQQQVAWASAQVAQVTKDAQQNKCSTKKLIFTARCVGLHL